MSTITALGWIKAPSGKSYEVQWDTSSHVVYVSWGGGKSIGKASSATEAMIKAEAWLYDK